MPCEGQYVPRRVEVLRSLSVSHRFDFDELDDREAFVFLDQLTALRHDDVGNEASDLLSVHSISPLVGEKMKDAIPRASGRQGVFRLREVSPGSQAMYAWELVGRPPPSGGVSPQVKAQLRFPAA